MRKNNRVGEKFVSSEGYKFIIVEYSNCDDLWIQFEDEYGARVHTNYSACKKGEIKNPYHKSVYGVACLGLMSDGTKPKISINGKKTREYDTWHGMVRRCYAKEFQEKYPTYKDCSICKHWLVYTNFLEDIKSIEGYELWLNNPNKRIALDKDIKGNGSKIYSLETVMFVDASENSKERNKRYSNSSQVSKDDEHE